MTTHGKSAPASGSRPNKTPPSSAPSHSEEERLRKARERAQLYRQESDPDAEAIPGLVDDPAVEDDLPETLDEWMDLVSKRVEEGMRRGLFDNLPGQGKPQQLQRDPFVPEEQQMAYNLMKKNQITPGWIGDRKAVLNAIDALRTEMKAMGEAFLARAGHISREADKALLAHEWRLCVNNWEERVVLLNKQILNLNLMQPYHHLEVYKLRLNEELARAGVQHDLFD